jgi:hypothetical protein
MRKQNEVKIEYGITITKPWSKAMYDHNDEVAEVVKAKVHALWVAALNEFQAELGEEFMTDVDWELVPGNVKAIQKAVTCYGFGFGYTVADVAERVEVEIEDAPYYRLKDMAEYLGIELEKGFVGFN